MAAATDGSSNLENARIKYAFWLAVTGFGLTALLVVFLVYKGWQSAQDIVAVIGLFTSVLGTLVGAFFGLQIGAAGRDKDQQERKDAQANLNRALSYLEPDKAREIINENK
ncbi:MAG: hypothetical protein JSS81_20680 [Acidobacteria bacterium]|nr:hypothetical protein [Acidobacteriota bacterium]